MKKSVCKSFPSRESDPLSCFKVKCSHHTKVLFLVVVFLNVFFNVLRVTQTFVHF